MKNQTKKGNIKAAAIDTGIDMGIALIGGGVLGAAVGKWSFWAGIPVAFAGAYMENEKLKMLGIGMTCVNGFQLAGEKVGGSTSGLIGTDEMYGTEGVDGFNIQQAAQGAKARIGNFFKALQSRVTLKPISAPAPSNSSSTGEIGETSYLENPANGLSDADVQMLGLGNVIGSVGLNEEYQMQNAGMTNGLGSTGHII